MRKKLIFFSILITAVFLLSKTVLAAEYASDSFKVVNPVIDYGGVVNSSSDNFKLTGALGQIAVGTSSNSTFQLKSGWLFFSAVTPAPTPIVVAAAGSNYSSYLESLIKLKILPLLSPEEVKPCDIAFDLDCDGKVGLKDFSIFLAVQNRPAPNPADFNKDNKIDFKDLSILLYGWTGKLLSFPEPAPGTFLAGAAGALPFRGEAAIFSLREISQSETVLKPAPEPPLAASLPQKPAIEKSGFFETAVQFILNLFNRIIKIFIPGGK